MVKCILKIIFPGNKPNRRHVKTSCALFWQKKMNERSGNLKVLNGLTFSIAHIILYTSICMNNKCCHTFN